MGSKLLIDAHYPGETRIAVLAEDGSVNNFETEYADRKLIKGNIYLAKVVRVESSIQAAFVDYGDKRHGFLPFAEISPNYYRKNSESDDQKEVENPSIQDVLHYGQVLLVQAIRERRGEKCAAFSTFLSLPGKYCVLVSKSNGKSGGISKKIDISDKSRLREIISSLEIPEGLGVIIRTAGEKRTPQEIKRDFEYLLRLWSEIEERAKSSNIPLLIHEEGNIIKRTIRDLYQRTMDKIIVQGVEAYKEARGFMKLFTPSHCKKVILYKDGRSPIFFKYGVEEKIRKILDTTVTLPSGGSIVINTTEALTAIDVNSGKMKSEKTIDTTAIKTNLEAAIEIARQIQLRDIAGLIVVDFIDMIDSESSLKVEKKFKECMSSDYSNTQIGRISQFGLLEISRQRLRQSLSDKNFVTCRHCNGAGRILSDETIGMSIIRQIEGFLVDANAMAIVVEVSNGIDLFILNNKRDILVSLEKQYNVFIEIVRNPSLLVSDCKIIIKEFREAMEDETIKQEPVKYAVYGSKSKSVAIKRKKSNFTKKKKENQNNVQQDDHTTESKPIAETTVKDKWIKKIFG
ncbi:MAG: Rne/Rng family ribonuclease [Holosporales bacterium]|jgi:ribonuclease E|nr:Rne/Rng family ribonuclease [Holosporales bacterium]